MTSQSPAQTENTPRNWAVWLCVAAGVFMATLDSSIVNISLPMIARDLQTTLPATQWVVLGYMLGLTGILLPLGKLSDMIGRRKVYVGGMLVFTIGSFLCGLAHSVEMLIAMRVVQAIGAAGIMSNGPAITAEIFRENRGKAIGLIGSVVSLGGMIGPTLGGWIVDAWGWPWIFWVNIPVGIISIIVAWGILSEFVSRTNERRFDWIGAILSIIILFSFNYLLTYGIEHTLLTPLNLAVLALFLVSLGVFIPFERKSPHPMLELKLFQRKDLTNACVASFLAFNGITCISFLTPFYLQTIRQMTPSFAGWILITTSVALAIVSPLSGHLADRSGSRRPAMLGMGISTIGLVLISQFTIQTPVLLIILGLLLVGVGNGLFHPPNNSLLLGSIPSQYLGLVSGLQAIVRTMGMAIGIAIVGLIYISLGATLTDPARFMPAYQVVFLVAAAVSALNIFWIGWYREKA